MEEIVEHRERGQYCVIAKLWTSKGLVWIRCRFSLPDKLRKMIFFFFFFFQS